jgi:hypothetical protein
MGMMKVIGDNIKFEMCLAQSGVGKKGNNAGEQ